MLTSGKTLFTRRYVNKNCRHTYTAQDLCVSLSLYIYVRTMYIYIYICIYVYVYAVFKNTRVYVHVELSIRSS